MDGFFCAIINNPQLAEILLPAVAVVMAAISGVKAVKLIRLRYHFQKSMILVPLYRNRARTISLAALLFLAAIGSVVMAFLSGLFVIFISAALAAFSGFFLLAVMSSVRFAVVDAGVVVPYRFIAWHELYDYYLNGHEIVFSGDSHGRRTLASTTIRMRFNVQDGHKLHIVLLQNKVKHKRD